MRELTPARMISMSTGWSLARCARPIRRSIWRRRTPTAFAECFHLTFTGVGRRACARQVAASASRRQPRSAVLMFHGYSGDSGEWFDKLGYVAQGCVVAALDCRGQGGLSEDNGAVADGRFAGTSSVVWMTPSPASDKLLFRNIFLDTAQLANIVMGWMRWMRRGLAPPRQPGRRPDGGVYVAGAPGQASGAGLPFLSDYKELEMDQDKDAYADCASTSASLTRRTRARTRSSRAGLLDGHHLAARTQGEVLWFTGLMDTICPPSTQFAAYNAITSPKSMVLYPDFVTRACRGTAT